MSTVSNPRFDIFWPEYVRPIRRLGEVIIPARRLYFLDFPLLFLSVGLLTWIFPTDTMLFVSSLVGGLVGLYALWVVAIRRGPIRVSHFFCIANVVGYGLGVLNSWLSIARGNLSLAEYFNRDPEAVAHAMATVLISSGVLFSLGELFETPIFGQDFRLPLDNRAVLFALFGTALIIVGYAIGEIGYMGGSDSGEHVSVLSGLIGWLFPTLFAFTCLCFLEWQKGMVKRLFGVLLAAQFILIIPTGRRSLVYFILIAIVATRFSSFKPKWSLSRKVVYAVILAVLVGAGAMAFYYLRYAAWGKQKVSLADRISLALALYESGNTGKVNQSLKENIQKRTFVLGYVSDLLDASFRIEPAMGQNALHEFQLVVPSFLWADKDAFLYSEENIANTTYHFAYKDEANSIYSGGAIDFGIWGMIFYPIIISILFRVTAEFARVNLPEVVATVVILFLLFNALITESGLWTRFVAIRNSLLFSIFLWFFFKIPAFALTHKPQKGVLSQ